jgi:hypothetical protein
MGYSKPSVKKPYETFLPHQTHHLACRDTNITKISIHKRDQPIRLMKKGDTFVSQSELKTGSRIDAFTLDAQGRFVDLRLLTPGTERDGHYSFIFGSAKVGRPLGTTGTTRARRPWWSTHPYPVSACLCLHFYLPNSYHFPSFSLLFHTWHTIEIPRTI